MKTYVVTEPQNFEGTSATFTVTADSYDVLLDTKVLEFYVEDEDDGADYSVATFAAGHWANVIEVR